MSTTRHNELIQRLQAFRSTIADLSAELDGHLGPGVPGQIANHLSAWSGALIALLVATPINPPPPPSEGVTTYNS